MSCLGEIENNAYDKHLLVDETFGSGPSSQYQLEGFRADRADLDISELCP
jgi:hypothetical protein